MTCQISEAVGVVIWRIDQSGFHWVQGYVSSELKTVFVVVDADFGKALLPNFTQVREFLFKSIGEAALDELHRFFDCHVFLDSDE